MIDTLGPAPAYALWARHARGVTVKDYQVIPQGTDARPAFLDEGI